MSKRRNYYSPSEIVKLGYSFIMTKVFFPQATIIERPVFIRGKKSIVGGKKLSLGRYCRFDLDGKKETLYIGNDCEFGDFTHFVALNNIQIGDNVLVASKVFISDCSHGNYSSRKGREDLPTSKPNDRELYLGKVKIGNNVWIGDNVVILPGAEIGDGCIIGANAIISTKIPEASIVVGNNKIIKTFNRTTLKWERTYEDSSH